MAYQCVYGGGECIGCMKCKEVKALYYDIYETPVLEGDVYYEFYNKQIVADENISDFLRDKLKTADTIMTDEFDEPILDGEDYYCIYGDIIAEKNIKEYLDGWEKYASYN